MKVKLISLTGSTLSLAIDGDERRKIPTKLSAEELIVYIARISNPANQMNMETAPRLIRHLIKNKHWSPFEHAMMTVEVTTSRGIAPQILRHRSLSFQEFSQRYAESMNVEFYEARRQDSKNRQNSIDDMSDEDKDWFMAAQREVWEKSFALYKMALIKGIAKEQARFLLPLNTETTLCMTGSARSWIHYLDVRCAEGVQKEHKDIAMAIRRIFVENFPSTAEALEWM